MKSTAPLDGINVLSLEHAIAAPLCTRQLAELGARVIKVERLETGDFARHYDDRVKGQSSHFVWTNRSKQSLTLNLKHQSSTEILNRLLPKVDVLVQNLAPSAADKIGLSYRHLHEHYPKLIVCNISGYGNDGPYQLKKAYDLLVQAEAGFLSITGTEGQMVKSGISIADIAAGMQAQSAVLAALIQRGKTGEGSNIEISMLEAMVEWMGFPLYYAYEGAEPPTRSGADHATIYPYGSFPTKDKKTIMLGLQNEREWEIFCCNVIEQADLTSDKRFYTNALRSENRDALRKIIASVFLKLNCNEVAMKLDTAQIAYANVNDMISVWKHPQLQALKRIVKTETPEGVVDSFLPPGNNSSYMATLGPVPGIGEHSRLILRELKFSEEEIKILFDDGVV